MRVFRGHLHAVPTPTAVAIGNFDGVHLGHAALLRQLVTTAAVRGLTPTVLTFEPHPREFFSPTTAPARLSTLREKLELLAEQGVAQTMVCPFNHRVVLRDALRARYVVIGDDFRFGRGRDGDFALLQAMGAASGFEVAAMGSVLRSGVRVSSSAVRAALSAGDLSLAAALLGRPYSMDGQVVRGRVLLGRLRFATANLRIKHNPLPLCGVFAVEVTGLGGEPLPGVANLGLRPTVGGTRPLLEVHLFDFSRDIYGAHIAVRFLKKLRDEQRFADFSALKAQIALDAAAARDFFATADVDS